MQCRYMAVPISLFFFLFFFFCFVVFLCVVFCVFFFIFISLLFFSSFGGVWVAGGWGGAGKRGVVCLRD